MLYCILMPDILLGLVVASATIVCAPCRPDECGRVGRTADSARLDIGAGGVAVVTPTTSFVVTTTAHDCLSVHY